MRHDHGGGTEFEFPAHAGMNQMQGRSVGGVPCEFPAHAGMNRRMTMPLREPDGVPRTRGDEP